jgi:hypothetical protein
MSMAFLNAKSYKFSKFSTNILGAMHISPFSCSMFLILFLLISLTKAPPHVTYSQGLMSIEYDSQEQPNPKVTG